MSKLAVPIISKILGMCLKYLLTNEKKAAAIIAAFPACFEYGYVGQAYAKPDKEAVSLYHDFIRKTIFDL